MEKFRLFKNVRKNQKPTANEQVMIGLIKKQKEQRKCTIRGDVKLEDHKNCEEANWTENRTN